MMKIDGTNIKVKLVVGMMLVFIFIDNIFESEKRRLKIIIRQEKT